MSKRKRVRKVPIELDEPRKIKSWNLEDKKNLLTALRKYGHKDIINISKMLPTKTKPAIRIMIYKIMQKSKTLSNNRNSALDGWLKSGLFDDKTAPIPEALKYISLFEAHPSPEESGGFDFRATYDHLHRMALGQPSMDVPPGTLKKINELMDEVRKEVWPSAESKIVRYLGRLEKKSNSLKTYPPRDRLRFVKNICWVNEDHGAGS